VKFRRLEERKYVPINSYKSFPTNHFCEGYKLQTKILLYSVSLFTLYSSYILSKFQNLSLIAILIYCNDIVSGFLWNLFLREVSSQ